jgi:hypothetical protein
VEDSVVGVEARTKRQPRESAKGFSGDSKPRLRHGPKAIERLVALMHLQNASVAARAAEALLDRGYGRPTQGMELSDEASPKHTVIRVVFVTPPKREASYSVSQRPSVIGLPEPK